MSQPQSLPEEVKWILINLPNLEELSFLTVFAFLGVVSVGSILSSSVLFTLKGSWSVQQGQLKQPETPWYGEA